MILDLLEIAADELAVVVAPHPDDERLGASANPRGKLRRRKMFRETSLRVEDGLL